VTYAEVVATPQDANGGAATLFVGRAGLKNRAALGLLWLPPAGRKQKFGAQSQNPSINF
jgi:hypothetical protein